MAPIRYISNVNTFDANKIVLRFHPIAFWNHLNNFQYHILKAGYSKLTILSNILSIFDNVRHQYNEKSFERHHQLCKGFSSDTICRDIKCQFYIIYYISSMIINNTILSEMAPSMMFILIFVFLFLLFPSKIWHFLCSYMLINFLRKNEKSKLLANTLNKSNIE